MNPGRLGGGRHLFVGCLRVGIADVVQNGTVEEEGILHDGGDAGAEALQGGLSPVGPTRATICPGSIAKSMSLKTGASAS